MGEFSHPLLRETYLAVQNFFGRMPFLCQTNGKVVFKILASMASQVFESLSTASPLRESIIMKIQKKIGGKTQNILQNKIAGLL